MRREVSLFKLLVLFCISALILAACGSSGNEAHIPDIEFTFPPIGGDTTDGEEGSLKWSFQTSGAVISSPALGDDGTIYVGSDDRYLYAIDADGKLKWKYETGDKITASPAIGSDGTIYVGSYDRQLYAINPDGTLKWVFPTRSHFSSSPAIGKDGTIYAGGTDQDKTIYPCDDGSMVTGQLSHLFAVNPDGTKKWSVWLKGEMDSTPAIGSDGTIYIGTDGDTVYDRSDYCDPNSEYPASNADLRYPVNGHLYAINPITGSIGWDFKTLGDVDSSPAIGSDGTIYVGSDARTYVYDGSDRSTLVGISPSTEGFVYAINSNGRLKWLFGYETTDPSGDAYGDVDSSPAIGSDGTIYFGSDKNDVFALNPADGSIKNVLNPDGSIKKWIYPTRGDVNSSPSITSDGTIYIGSEDGSLYALNPDATVKWVYDASSVVNSSPTIGSDGTVYVGSGSSLLAIIGKSELMNSPWPKFRYDLKNKARK